MRLLQELNSIVETHVPFLLPAISPADYVNVDICIENILILSVSCLKCTGNFSRKAVRIRRMILMSHFVDREFDDKDMAQ